MYYYTRVNAKSAEARIYLSRKGILIDMGSFQYGLQIRISPVLPREQFALCERACLTFVTCFNVNTGKCCAASTRAWKLRILRTCKLYMDERTNNNNKKRRHEKHTNKNNSPRDGERTTNATVESNAPPPCYPGKTQQHIISKSSVPHRHRSQAPSQCNRQVTVKDQQYQHQKL